LRLLAKYLYDEKDRLLDALNGKIAVFPITKPLIVAVICWTWILTN
jgi:hypothetical protein